MMMTTMMVVLAAAPVSLQFEGTLKEGLTQLAQKSGLNLVVIGELNDKVQLNLPNVDGEEALETIAQAYELKVTKSGKGSKMWVVRRAAAEVAMVTPPPAAPSLQFVIGGGNSSDTLRSEADAAREAAERAREQAEDVRAKLESMKNATADAKDRAREALEEAKERAQEAADEAKEKAQEAAEAVREQAEEAAEAERDRLEALRDQAEAQKELAKEKSRLARDIQRQRVSTGGPVTVEKDSRVEAAVAYGGPVIVEENAVVEGDAVAFGGDVVLKEGAVVEGDAVSFGGSVVREKGSAVHGEIVSMGGSSFGATVAREVVKAERAERHEDAAAAQGDSRSSDDGRGVARFLALFALMFGVGFLMMMFAPQRAKALEASIRSEPVKNGLAGFLGTIALAPISAALVVTLVGIPVLIVAYPVLLMLVAAGVTVVANAIGSKLPTGRWRKTQALVLALGTFALLLVFHIPGLGVVALVGTSFLSLGAVIRTRFGKTGTGMPMLDPMQSMAQPLL